MKRYVLFCVAVATAVVCVGCTKYYQVTDPSTGKIYYTTDVENKSGATMLEDDKSGSKVTIQNSEVTEITKDQYKKAVNTK